MPPKLTANENHMKHVIQALSQANKKKWDNVNDPTCQKAIPSVVSKQKLTRIEKWMQESWVRSPRTEQTKK